MSNLNRFIHRERPTTPRDPQDDQVAKVLSLNTPPDPSLDASPNQSEKPVSDPIAALQAELDAFPETVAFTIRVEANIRTAIGDYTRKEGITPECLLQGLWQVAQENPTLLKQATQIALSDHNRRKRIGELKKTLGRLKNLSQ